MPGYTDEELEAMLADIESDLAERKESFSGDAPNKVREAVCAFANDLPDHRKPGVVFIGARDNGSPSGVAYPLPALQQLVRNAVMHRTYEASNMPVRVYWYDDRIEITSPGGPFVAVSIENFGQPGVADYRNPNLAEAMRVLGFVQRFGAGLAIARRELASNGNPPPEFVVQLSHVHVTVRAAR